MRQHIGVKLDETHLTHFFQVSRVQMLACLRIHENYHYVTRFFIASCFNFGLSLCLSQIVVMGEIMVKGTKGTKVKVLFQGLYMTHVIIALIYISRTPPLLQIHFQLQSKLKTTHIIAIYFLQLGNSFCN